MIESWDWLIQLVEAGSFTRASEKLHVSQQTLSARLATLEKELETKLVVRSSPLALTRAIAQRYPGCELTVAYIDSYGDSVGASWIAD